MIREGKLELAQKELKQVTNINRRISTVMYFESHPLTFCPHLRKVSNNISCFSFGSLKSDKWRLPKLGDFQ